VNAWPAWSWLTVSVAMPGPSQLSDTPLNETPIIPSEANPAPGARSTSCNTIPNRQGHEPIVFASTIQLPCNYHRPAKTSIRSLLPNRTTPIARRLRRTPPPTRQHGSPARRSSAAWYDQLRCSTHQPHHMVYITLTLRQAGTTPLRAKTLGYPLDRASVPSEPDQEAMSGSRTGY
jgi:hypothetical protein